jgi:hypothetical protein
VAYIIQSRENVLEVNMLLENAERNMSINPLKTKLVSMLFKSVPQREHQTSTITKINWLMLFKEIIAVYSENHAKPRNTK